MSNQKRPEKLQFNRETLRVLDDKELEQLAGGASATCNHCTDDDNKTLCGGGGSGPFHDY